MMKFRFQSFFDIQTSATTMQIIQWSVGGQEVLNRCRHLFGAYKYFKLGKISVKFVPASTLPVDPLGLSYSTSDPQTVDPRDQMNPGLVRITNGEDVFTKLSAIPNLDDQMKMYNAMMLDPRWSKFMLQSGFRRSAYPLYWQIGQLHQDKWPGATDNIPSMTNSAPNYGVDTVRTIYDSVEGKVETWRQGTNSSPAGLFQVGHRGKLGFLPTDFYQQMVTGNGNFADCYGVNNIPEVSVITCVLPRAYKTIYYYRVFITEEVIFTGLRSTPMPNSDGTLSFGADQFLMVTPTAIKPGVTMPAVPSVIPNNGGGQQ